MGKTIRRKPTLSKAERERRARFAKKVLLPKAIEATGKKGFRATKKALEKYQNGITDVKKLAGWLKGQAKEKGVLSSKHPYMGRRKKR
ncbi:MAG: hypothetical protein AB1567_12345, partial [bacterium]